MSQLWLVVAFFIFVCVTKNGMPGNIYRTSKQLQYDLVSLMEVMVAPSFGRSWSASPHGDKTFERTCLRGAEVYLGLRVSEVSVCGHLTLSLETVTAQCPGRKT